MPLLVLLPAAQPQLLESQQLVEGDAHDRDTPAYPRLRSPVGVECTACARLVDNFDMSLLPRLRERAGQLHRHHARTRLAATATIGDLEEIVESEVERICSWPRTHHNIRVRRACASLVETHDDKLVVAISQWAREGGYGEHLNTDALAAEVRPMLCEAELGVCTAAELVQLEVVDVEERAQLADANETGRTPERPMESERPSPSLEGVLLRVVAEDFVDRIVERAAETDFLVYLYFPGRSTNTDDTHARMRAKFIKLAQFLDAPSSNGSLAVGWMDVRPPA